MNENSGVAGLLMVPETLGKLGVSRTRLYQLLNSGELKAVKVGVRTMFRPVDVAAFIDSRPAYDPTALKVRGRRKKAA